MTELADDALYAFRRNVVVAASAGTGKTFRLVSLYALLNLGLTSLGRADDERRGRTVLPAQIAATTFSRAAAAEMRARTERLLSAIASGVWDRTTAAHRAVLEARVSELGEPALDSSIMKDRAEQALHQLPGALIDTFHGVAARLLRGAAVPLGLSPGFAIEDEEEAAKRVDAAMGETLSQALTRGDPAATYLLDVAGGLANARVEVAALLARADEEGVAPGQLFAADAEASARELTDRLGRVTSELVTEKSKALSAPAAAVARALLGLRTGDGTHADLEEPLVALFGTRMPKNPLPCERAFEELRDGIRGENNTERAKNLVEFVKAAPWLAGRTQGVIALLDEACERLGRARRKANALAFGDLLRLSRRALCDRGAHVAEARRAIDVLLVDEFQDTSRVQRDMIYLLREKDECAAVRRPGVMPAVRDIKPDGLLIVGDRKQSIYGFRGADVSVFTRLVSELAGEPARVALELGPALPAADEPTADIVMLTENHRSSESILAFVNAFASADFAAAEPDRPLESYEVRYAAREHLRAPRAAREERAALSDMPESCGVVVIKDDGAPLDAALRERADPAVRGATGPMREAWVAAAVIDRAVRGEGPDPIAFRDIAILARRRATLPFVQFTLAHFGIPFAVAGRGFFDTREVRDLAAVLRLLVDPHDRHALAVVLRGPALGLSDTGLALLSEPGTGLASRERWFTSPASATGLAERLDPEERASLLAFSERFDALATTAVRMAPADALRSAMRELELDRVMGSLPGATQRLANADRLVALASRQGGGLPTFVRWLDRQIADQSDEPEAVLPAGDGDRVALLTMHGSKGLEFRMVLLLDLAAPPRPSYPLLGLSPSGDEGPARLVLRHTSAEGAPLFTPERAQFLREQMRRELAERKRLTYVAMTRAREHLVLIAPLGARPGCAAATLEMLLANGASPPGFARVEDVTPLLLRVPESRVEEPPPRDTDATFPPPAAARGSA